MKSKIKINILISLVLTVCLTTFFTACEEDYSGKYKTTDGVPTITFIRYQTNDMAEQLLDGALMGESLIVIGDNLTSVQEVWFNNVRAILNINFITKNSLLVNVPNNLPSIRTDKIYFVTGKNDTVSYDFEVRIPPPVIDRIKCEFVPAGYEVVLIGNYFLAPDASMLNIFIDDYEVPTADIVSYEQSKIVFKAPSMDIKGQIEVKTLYGKSGRTKEVFRDDRGWITGFEDDENGGTGFVAGWGRPTQIEDDPAFALMGRYVKLARAAELTPDAWVTGGSDMTINIWSRDNNDNPNSGIPNPMFSSDPKTSTLKFEVNVIQAWSGIPMIFMFDRATGNEDFLWADGTNAGDGAPRAFWVPWLTTGSYLSDGWETISIPLSEFKYNGYGVEVPGPTSFGQLGISIHNRGMDAYAGTACSPVFLIDNIRVVP